MRFAGTEVMKTRLTAFINTFLPSHYPSTTSSEFLSAYTNPRNRLQTYHKRTSHSPKSIVRAMSTTQTTTSTTQSPFKIALCQIPVTAVKEDNLKVARSYLDRAHAAGAKLAVLPECFNSPYDTNCFRQYAETLPEISIDIPNVDKSPSLAMIRTAAIETGMYIIGGSIPELAADGRVFNTSLSVSPEGLLIAKHRKAHLFDINVPGGICFRESDVLSAGQDATCFEAPPLGCSVGVAICYDLRFPELAMVQVRDFNASLLVYPGAFNLTTGPAHWELLLRARALDNQVFVAACSPARATGGNGYKAWGHSMLVDPWGTVVAQADEKEALILAEVDLERMQNVRSSIPTIKQRRIDMYKVEYKAK